MRLVGVADSRNDWGSVSLMALIFVRHGSSRLNAGDPADPRDMFRGWSNVPLSDFGQKTVAQTAAWLKQVPVSQIVSSDLPRAVQTAQMISQATGATVQADPRLRPLNVGTLTGKVITPAGKQLLEDAHENWDKPLPGGETYRDFINRYTSIFPELLQAGQQGNVVVVSHHRNLLALPHLFFGKPLQTKGPPEPGGVMVLSQKGLVPLFTPPAVQSVYKEHAVS